MVYCNKDLAIAKEVGDRAGEGRAYCNLGNVYTSLRQHSKAVESLEKGFAKAGGGKVVIPAQQEILPSAALGWFSGGEIATSSSDQSGRRAAEPFFEVRADLDPGPEVVLVHGCSGKIRFTLEPQPLLQQWYRKLRQLIQKRYEI